MQASKPRAARARSPLKRNCTAECSSQREEPKSAPVPRRRQDPEEIVRSRQELGSAPAPRSRQASEESVPSDRSTDDLRRVLFSGLFSPSDERRIAGPTDPCPPPRADDESRTAQSAPWFDAQDIVEERNTEPAPERNRTTLVPTGEEPEKPQPLEDLIETASAEARLQRISLIERCLTERFADGDFDGALQAAQQILSQVPSHEGAQSYAKSCQRLIERRHLARIGGLSVVPYLAVSKEQLPFLALDHREGFLVSLVDGATPIGELIDISGLNPLDVLKTIAGLLDAEVLQLR